MHSDEQTRASVVQNNHFAKRDFDIPTMLGSSNLEPRHSESILEITTIIVARGRPRYKNNIHIAKQHWQYDKFGLRGAVMQGPPPKKKLLPLSS